MSTADIILLREFDPQSKRAALSYGIPRDETEPLTIPELQARLIGRSSLVSARVEAHWPEETRPEKLLFCGSMYDFNPISGVIVARAGVMIHDSELEAGTVVHPNVTISGSLVQSGSEVRNMASIFDSRIGKHCLIGVNTIVRNSDIPDISSIADMDIIAPGADTTSVRTQEEQRIDQLRQEGTSV